MTKGQKKRSYTEGFKLKAVRRMEEGERVKDICDDLKVGNSMLYMWRKKLSRPSKTVGQGHGPKDAIIYLRQARNRMTMKDVRNPICLLALMALTSLEGHV